jgi:hypothetical protein
MYRFILVIAFAVVAFGCRKDREPPAEAQDPSGKTPLAETSAAGEATPRLKPPPQTLKSRRYQITDMSISGPTARSGPAAPTAAPDGQGRAKEPADEASP